jgi:hypothetical protein
LLLYFLFKVLCVKISFSTQTTHQTISESNLFEPTRSTKHTEISQHSLARLSLAEDR